MEKNFNIKFVFCIVETNSQVDANGEESDDPLSPLGGQSRKRTGKKHLLSLSPVSGLKR